MSGLKRPLPPEGAPEGSPPAPRRGTEEAHRSRLLKGDSGRPGGPGGKAGAAMAARASDGAKVLVLALGLFGLGCGARQGGGAGEKPLAVNVSTPVARAVTDFEVFS